MIDIRPFLVLSFAAMVLGGCGRSAKDDLAATYCPEPLTVQDTQKLTRFKPGPGRDPRDIMFEGSLVNAATQCSINKNRMDIVLKVLVAANAGPAVGTAPSSVPYFVRVVDSSGTVREGRDFAADFRLSAANPRGSSIEALVLTLPFGDRTDLGAYRIIVGLKPTPEELQYNRRSEGR